MRQLTRVSKCLGCIGLVMRTMVAAGADRPQLCGIQPPPQPPWAMTATTTWQIEKEGPVEDRPRLDVDRCLCLSGGIDQRGCVGLEEQVVC
jgi:hypothetical protein